MTKGVKLEDEEIQFLAKLVEARAKELSKFTEDDDAVEELSDVLRIKVMNVFDRVIRKAYVKGELDGYNSCDCW